jgi:hypothetical protein
MMDKQAMIDAIKNAPANKVETPEEHAKRYPASRMQDLNERYKQTLDSNILYEYIDMCKQYFKPHELLKMQKVFTQKIKDFNALYNYYIKFYFF